MDSYPNPKPDNPFFFFLAPSPLLLDRNPLTARATVKRPL
ncbi:hypothetical protein COLO4_17156 [Corchorus olitorius]|uniref:Uncharacterized protein n=1 Tax=Corchorus olitorius TaxID=93759 RepID=A0A1R3JDZ0_9ROSI|nr:hypothetical protein COLO4_17156 [Corchorus olitorius]